MPALHAELVVDGHLPEDQLHIAIKGACRQLLPAWAALQDADIAIGFISGGISNALFKVAPGASSPGAANGAASADHNGSTAAAVGAQLAPPPPVAFRVYGDNTEQFVDRERELGIMELVHSHGFGPAVLGTFSNGRIEEFLFKRCLLVGAARTNERSVGGRRGACALGRHRRHAWLLWRLKHRLAVAMFPSCALPPLLLLLSHCQRRRQPLILCPRCACPHLCC